MEDLSHDGLLCLFQSRGLLTVYSRCGGGLFSHNLSMRNVKLQKLFINAIYNSRLYPCAMLLKNQDKHGLWKSRT